MHKRVVIVDGSHMSSTLVAAIAQALVHHDVCVIAAGNRLPAKTGLDSIDSLDLGKYAVMEDAHLERNHHPSYRMNFKSGKPLRY